MKIAERLQCLTRAASWDGFAAVKRAGHRFSAAVALLLLVFSFGTAAQTIAPASFSFGNVPLTVSVTQTMTLTATGTMTITSLSASDARFTVSGSATSPCTVSLVLNLSQSCNFDVTFTPTGTGAYNNTTTIGYNNALGAPLTTAQNSNGTGFAPPFTLSPPSIGFGNQVVGVPATQSFTFTNTSNTTSFPSTYTLTGFTTSGLGFTAAGSGATPCAVSLTLAAGASCGVTVTFTAAGVGSSNGTSSLNFLAGLGADPPYLAQVALNGNGVTGPVATITGSGTFPNTVEGAGSAVQAITLQNTGGANLTLSAISLTAPGIFVDTTGGPAPNAGHYCGFGSAADGSILTGAAKTLTPGQSCTINLIFTPKAQSNYNYSLAFTTDAAGSPHTVALSGTAAAPTINLGPALNFANQVEGTASAAQTVTLTNASPVAITLTSAISVSSAGPFSVSPSGAIPCTSGLVLAGGASCTASVVFAPTSTASFGNGLTVSYQVITSLLNTGSSLGGNSLAPTFTLGPALNFGNVAVGGSSAAQTVTFTNTSPTSLTVTVGPSSSNPVFSATPSGVTPCNVSTVVPPAGTCTFSSIFTPAALSSYSASYNMTVQAVTSVLPATAAASGTGVAAAAGPYVYIANQAGANVSVINPATNTVVATIPVGGTPRGVAVNVAGTRAYVANQGGGSLSVIDTTTNTVIASPAAGPGPSGIALNQAGTRAYIANVTGQKVTVLDTATNTQLGTVTVGSQPVGIAVSPTGAYVYVANNVSGTVSVIETTGLTVVATVTVGSSPRGIAINPAGTRVYVANETSGTVSVIDTATNLVTASIPGTNPSFVAVNGAGTRLYVADGGSDNLLVIDTATNTQIGAVPVGVTAFGVAVNATDTIAYVPNLSSNTVSVIDLSTLTVTATVTVGSGPASFGAFTQPAAVATSAPAITSGAPASGNVGTAYSHQFTASGTGPIQWSVATGTLPAGLVLNSSSGVLSGTPTATGTFGFTLQASNGLAPNATQNVSIAVAAAAGPVFSPSASTLTFASQTVATTSVAQTLTITNTGSAIMSITGPSVAGPFAISGNTCTGLAPAGTCTMSVTFTPVATGAATGTLTIPTNAPGSPHVISLTGTGVAAGAPALTVAFAPASVATATNAAMTLTLSNPNASPAIISIGGTVTVPGLTMSGLVDGCGASASIGTGFIDMGMAGSIPALGSCTITVQVQSATAGSFPVTVNPGNLVTSFGNNTNTSTATLTVIALAPIITLAPTSLNFGTRTVNTTSPPSTVTVTNTGTAAAFLSSIVNTGDFAFTTTCPLFSAPLNVGASCTISTTFTPLSPTAIAGNITINSSAPGSPHVINLSGTGAAVGVTNIAVNPASLDFGTLTAGTGSAPYGVVVSNTGFANLLLSAVTIVGPFARVAQATVPPDCGTSVAPGAACTLSIAFTPAVTGSASGQLSIAHNATGSPTLIPLAGVATAVPVPVLSVAPNIAFGDQVLGSPVTSALNLANTGSANLNIGAVNLTGSPDFTLSGTCSVIAPASSCVVNVGFRPTSVGPRSGQIDITSNSGSTQAATGITSVAVSGNGILAPRPAADVSVTAIGFGNTIFGGASNRQLVTLTSVGSSPLEVRNVFIAGPDFVQSGSCPGTLPTGATCVIGVLFSPLGIGGKTGELQIVSSAPESPHRVSLSGRGCRWFSQTASRFFLTSCGN